MMPVILTDRAKTSLNDIALYYLIEYTASRSEKVVNSIYGSFDRIAKSPMSFPICYNLNEPIENIRQLVVHNTFKVIYRIKPDCIEIIEIFHGSRNEKLLKDIS